MQSIDTTVLATALPTISADLAAPLLSLKLALTSYLISLAVCIPVSGWLADHLGAKRIFVTSIMIFMIGSLLCAIQTSLLGLIVFRALQGIGGAMMVPVGRLIVVHSVPKEKLVGALAYVTIPALVGPAIGPLLGATITTLFGWHWIFLINVPIGTVGLMLAWHYVPTVGIRADEPLDWTGFAMSGAGLAAIMFGISALGDHLFATKLSSLLVLFGTVVFAAYWLRARRGRAQLMDPRLLAFRSFRVGLFGGLLFRTTGGAASFLLPLLFQIGFSMSIMKSGLLSGLFALGGLAIRGFVPRLIDNYGFRPLLLLGAMGGSLSLAAFGFMDFPHYFLLIPLLLAAGLFQATAFAAANGLVYARLPEEELTRATSMVAVSQQLALTIGLGVSGFVMQIGSPLNPPPSQLEFAWAFWVSACVGLSALVLFAQLNCNDGADLRDRENAAHHIWH